MNWTDLIHAEMEDAYKAADGLMAMVSDGELDWKPATGRNWMTVGQVMLHMATACGYCMVGFIDGQWAPPADLGYPEDMEGMLPAEKLPTARSVAWARDYLQKDRQAGLGALARAGEKGLAGTRVAAPWNPGQEEILGRHCLQMVTHLNTHKAQLFYYLKLMGKDVNTLNLWGV